MTATERGGFSFLFTSQKHKSGEQKSGKDDWRIHFSLHGGGVQEVGGGVTQVLNGYPLPNGHGAVNARGATLPSNYPDV